MREAKRQAWESSPDLRDQFAALEENYHETLLRIRAEAVADGLDPDLADLTLREVLLLARERERVIDLRLPDPRLQAPAELQRKSLEMLRRKYGDGPPEEATR